LYHGFTAEVDKMESDDGSDEGELDDDDDDDEVDDIGKSSMLVTFSAPRLISAASLFLRKAPSETVP
jgi:hypothetical protein